MTEIVSLLIILVSSTLLFYLLVSKTVQKKKINNRVETFVAVPFTKEEEKEEKKERTSKKTITLLAKAFTGMKFSEKTNIMLEQAGIAIKGEEFMVIRLVSALGLGSFLYSLGLPLTVSIVFIPIGFIFPHLYVKRKIKKRLNLLSFQLVEALGTMANSMRAGFSFTQTMQLISKEMPDPIGPEFDRVVRELGLGIPLEKVFRNMLSRLPNKELEVVLQAILAQRKTGGNLADLLETMEETVRGRIRILEELKTLTAQGKMSSWVITLLPIFMAFYLYFASPDYFGPMLSHPLGWLMLAAGSICIVIGWLLIQKIVRIEV